MEEKPPWSQASSEAFTQIQEIKKSIKKYSYETKAASHATDEHLCSFFLKKLFSAKKRLYAISDLLFSLQTGSSILPLVDTLRDEVDILMDEVQARLCSFKPLTVPFLVRLIRHDEKLLKAADKLDKDLEKLFLGILEVTKKPVPFPAKRVAAILHTIRAHLKEVAILFKEREALCNLKPLSLEKTFALIQKEIRLTV